MWLFNLRNCAFTGEVPGKEGMTFWAMGGRDRSFYIKNELKSEILNDKKKLQTEMFTCHN